MRNVCAIERPQDAPLALCIRRGGVVLHCGRTTKYPRVLRAPQEEQRVRDALILSHALNGGRLSRTFESVADPVGEPIHVDKIVTQGAPRLFCTCARVGHT
jgi:hypothetical protein